MKLFSSFMKTAKVAVMVFLFASTAFAGAAAPVIAERGPHHRTWANVREIQTPRGVTLETNTYVELQTGLHRWTDQGWVETDPRIEIFQDGAIVRNLQYQVIFSPNLADAGSLDILLPGGQEGQRLRGHLLGLAYREGNQLVFISEVKECAGIIGGAEQNELTFADAFTDFHIDVKYVVQRGKLSQSILILDRLPHPREVGLSDAAHVELMTEWVNFPAPQRDQRVLEEAQNGQRALTDERIDFGPMRLAAGKAFAIGEETSISTRVAKSWEELIDETGNRRTFLVEKIPWRRIEPELQNLPPPQAAVLKDWQQRKKAILAEKKPSPLPPRKVAKTKTAAPIQMMAKAPTRAKGYFWDFELGISTNFFRFRGDLTYYISGEIMITTNFFEGGAVIKYAPTNYATLAIDGPVTFQTDPYRPVVFTARDDDSVGEKITGSTGIPSGYYGQAGLQFWVEPTQNPRHLRFSYLHMAMEYGGWQDTIRDCQFISCNYGVVNSQTAMTLENILMYRVYKPFVGDIFDIHASHLTVRECNALIDGLGATVTLRITNSILVNMTNWGTSSYYTNAVLVGTDSSVFQTVGAAAHYLAANSPYRNIGTANISSTLLADLKKKTTYPPIVIPQGNFTNSVVLHPQAQRDTDTLDLGYHYEPLDFALGSVHLTNATMEVKAGTVLATFVPGAGERGLALMRAAKFFCDGSPTNLIRIVRYNTVQEQANTNWSAYRGPSVLSEWYSDSPGPEARFRFTQWSTPAQDSTHFYGWQGNMPEVSFTDCQFHGGAFNSDWPTLNMTNNLFERVYVSVVENNPMSTAFFNNTFYGGTLDLGQDSGTWTFKDNLFDKTTISVWAGSVSNDYNAYITNYSRLSSGAAHDLILTNSPAYHTGPLGHYYFPTNDGMLSKLINAGSVTNAGLRGLSHFTTTTNQVKETNSWLDIGFHFVAVTNGVPFDADGDVTPDYAEDANGNGSVNSGETDWNNASDWGLKVWISRPRENSLIP